mgnify:CR=1 FL=1
MDYLPKPYHTRIWKAIYEHELLQADDRLLIGLSGGKDSMFAAYAFSAIKSYSKIPFSLEAVTVDIGFDTPMDSAALEAFCSGLGMGYHYIPTRIAGIIDSKKDKASPCSVCAYFRRAAMHRFASENGFNKVLLAHHQDDAMETFLMNILHTGRIGTLPWKTDLTRTGVTVIRPLMYLSEHDISRAVRRLSLPVQQSPCPYSCDSSRARTRQLIRDMCKDNKMVRANLVSAMVANDSMELWPSSGRHYRHEQN